MKAIVVHEPGEPEVLRFEEVETPEPREGQVLIEVYVAGVNYADIGMRRGMMGGPHAMELPYTPGFEVAGTVAAVGAGVNGFERGDRVAAVLPAGGYTEYAVADEGSLVKLPEGVDFASSSALLVQGITAYGILHDSARIQEGESVLVQAAAGGVGSLTIQLARLAGAGIVIGTAGNEEKRELVRDLGADIAVDYTNEGWVDRVLEATEGRGVDVVLESVGGSIGAGAYECLALLGRLVTFGAASGEGLEPPDMWQLNLKGQSVSGFGGPWLRPGRAAAARREISNYLRDNSLRVVEGASFPLAEAAAAHGAIEGRKTVGKVSLIARDGSEQQENR